MVRFAAFTRNRSGLCGVLLCLCFAISVHQVTGVKVQFLKEILMGRCYYNPPTGIAGSCPSVVDYIISGLEGHLDQDITSSTFSSYFAGANFHPPSNRGLFWLKGDVAFGERSKMITVLPEGWNTPEMTPGGALMEGLNFCGIDLRQDCPRISGASTVFWCNAYRAYAKEVRKEVHVILEENAYLYPLLEGAIPSLSPDNLSTVALYAANCQSQEVLTVTAAFADAMNKLALSSSSITCTENLASLALCQDSTSAVCQCLMPKETQLDADTTAVNVTVEAPNIAAPVSNASTIHAMKANENNGHTYKVLFWVLLLTSLVFYAFSRRHEMKGYRTIPIHVDPLIVQQ